jgi:hypothetical protein
MRKTVHEWLESNENGKAMPRRKKRRRKPSVGMPKTSDTGSQDKLPVKRRRKPK